MSRNTASIDKHYQITLNGGGSFPSSVRVKCTHDVIISLKNYYDTTCGLSVLYSNARPAKTARKITVTNSNTAEMEFYAGAQA